MVCSNCAAGLPSVVTVVQLSGHVMQSVLPIERIGSAVQNFTGSPFNFKTEPPA